MRLPKINLAGVFITLTVLVIAAGYGAKSIEYTNLFDLYQQQNIQLRANGIQPNTPTPSQVYQQGPAGAAGTVGTAGVRGTDGLNGTNGLNGLDGMAGAVGATGAPGINGTSSNGVDGAPGANGANGAAGAAGADGAPGPAGRGIATITCVLLDDKTTVIRFTFTDAAVQDIKVNCAP